MHYSHPTDLTLQRLPGSMAAVATLSYAPTGRSRLGRVGAVAGVLAAMAAHPTAKAEIHVKPPTLSLIAVNQPRNCMPVFHDMEVMQLYGCASLVRLCLHADESARENQKQLLSIQGAAQTIFNSMRTYANHPTLISQCGSLLKGGHRANELPSSASSTD